MEEEIEDRKGLDQVLVHPHYLENGVQLAVEKPR